MIDTIKGEKSSILQWTKEADQSFEYLKTRVAHQPILNLPEFNKVFTIECDASGYALEVVLSQEGKPIALFSEKLNEAKKKNSSYDLEQYAMVQALNKWRHYLVFKEFVVYTYNHDFKFLNSQEKLIHLHMKWVEKLQPYTFTIKCKKWQANKVVNALRRRTMMIQEVKFQIVGIDSLRGMYQNDADFQEVSVVCEQTSTLR